MAIVEKTLYLTTDGVYHTDEELAQDRQTQLNNEGGKQEAIEDLDNFIKSRLPIGSSKYWTKLYSQALSSKRNSRTNGVDMFKDLLDKDFDDMYLLALSIAAHKYTLPVSLVWQTESDKEGGEEGEKELAFEEAADIKEVAE